ncbi:MAG: flagellar filament capping protein FliD [Azonexus sp.]|nr:flagellar filament capping protein FliD [Azonexus sp.]
MTSNLIQSTGFDYALLQNPGVGAANQALSGNFAATLQTYLASVKAQMMTPLISSLSGGNENGLASLLGGGSANDLLTGLLGQNSAASGLAANGYNMALFDPVAGYRMMSDINQRDVNYRAEYAEMTDLGAYVAALEQKAGQLAEIDTATPAVEIESRLQDFVSAYNDWIDRFDEQLASGGLLAGTQAATIAQWELEQSVENIFNGAASGVRGLGALGVSVDPVSNMARLDPAQLHAVLANNRDGAVAAIDAFSAHFARSAALLNSAGNFIPNRMDNLSRVIAYLDQNKPALQAEFGLGDAARLSANVARALAAYEAMKKPTA